MSHPSSPVADGATGMQNRRWLRSVIILFAAIALGLTYNALSPNGIPLVKKAPSITNG